ncbi:unnamed protein product [Triticum turgidum subsp. durum]|uniref:BZIP domain-containing protein n=1 Tax=Triticum turgidum subsp. durum TaxID=4567 RepID=A0A9R0Y8M2_TRITD|nr:unnamed protein product [Triticum turgidum subsp. durum]
MVNPLSLANGLMTGAYGQGGGGGGGGAAAMVSPSPTGRPVMSNGYGKMEGLNLSSLSPPPMPYVFSGGLRGRKPPAMEKVVERRQRRMIKNRESAARSRQRKQSYMMELESEVAKLKERNEELQRKQVAVNKNRFQWQLSNYFSAKYSAPLMAEMLERQKNEVFEKVTRQAGPTSKRICLRRTLTGPWEFHRAVMAPVRCDSNEKRRSYWQARGTAGETMMTVSPCCRALVSSTVLGSFDSKEFYKKFGELKSLRFFPMLVL